jgi:oligopeptide/dipeptide ABC transporter ATP-binding protein
MSTLLAIQNLQTYFFTPAGLIKAINGVDLHIGVGETLALVGESGCGKSLTALSLLRLVPEPGRIVGGEIRFDGQDLLRMPLEEMRRVRGNRIGMIFQEPMTSLSPLHTIGNQIGENVLIHEKGVTEKQAKERTIEMLGRVGIPRPQRLIDAYPHQLSGGMRQRAMIAMALICGPRLLIGDEPTTALDVTIEAQILDLIKGLQADFGMAIMYISHDLAVVGEMADEIMVMYLGQVMEHSSTDEIFDNPLHPYTSALWRSIPTIDGKLERLIPISGSLPSPFAILPGCRFFSRCDRRIPGVCDASPPELKEVAPGHKVRCFLYQ